MRELRLVAVSDDGSHLVVRTAEPDDEQFRLPLDERLRAAVRRDVARLGRLDVRPESSLTPREIQAQLRAGKSAEDVAAAAGVAVERVTRFEGPVLAERQRRVAEAWAATPHRPSGSPHQPLGALAAAFLARERVDPDSVMWDAWLGEDGTWQVALSYRVGERTRAARWSWDVARHHLAPLDKGAEVLAHPPPDPSPLPRLAPVAPAAPAVVHDPWAVEATDESVPQLTVEQESSEIGRLAAAAEAASLPPTAVAADSPEEPAGAPDPGPGAGATEAIAAGAAGSEPAAESEEAAAAGSTDAEPAGAANAEPASATDEESTAPGEVVPTVPEAPAPLDEPMPAAGMAEPTRSGTSRSARRASVPSWDDILLGTRSQP